MSNRKTIRKPAPKPTGPRIVYQCSDVEREAVGVLLKEWRELAAFAQAKQKELERTVALIRKQQGLPDAAEYHEQHGAFVVTAEPPPTT